MQTDTTTSTPAANLADDDTGHRATYSPEDNKIRIYPAHRLDADTYARVKAAGFAWAPRQELFVAPMWTPRRDDLARELCGEVGDEDTTLAERAEERADRFTEYRGKRTEDAGRARDAVRQLSDGIPFGQPILVGHHSQRRAEKDAQRIRDGMRRAVDMWETAEYWQRRAAGAVRAAKYKERPDVRARRIKGIEADARKVQRDATEAAMLARVWTRVHNRPWDDMTAAALYVAGRSSGIGYGLYNPLKDGTMHGDTAARQALRVCEAEAARCARWAAHYAGRLAYERAMLAAETGGAGIGAQMAAGVAGADAWDLQPGGKVRVRGEWCAVLRVTRKDGRAVSVRTTARYCSLVGVEDLQAYEPPTEEAAAAAKAATVKAPLCNYPAEGCATMTAAEWAKIYTDSKGTREAKATATHGAHRHRVIMGFIGRKFGATGGDSGAGTCYGMVPVFISDAKRTDPPAQGGSDKPPAKPRKSTARKVAEAHGVDTSDTPPTTAEAETCAHLGRLYRVRASFPVGVEGARDVNAWMTANPGGALLCEQKGRYIVAHEDDKGEPVNPATLDAPAQRTAARLVLRELTEPGPIETAAEVERMQARHERHEAAKADAAPFDAMREALRTGQAVRVVSVPQLFPTPADVAARMVALAGLPHRAGVSPRVLEPSAGTGALLDALRTAYASATMRAAPVVEAFEVNAGLAQRLREKYPSAHVWTGDFLQVQPPHHENLCRVVLMNPPFRDAADVAHILHARRFLAPGGRLVAICAAGPRQHDALQGLADSWEYLPPGTFAGTNVRAVLLTMGPTP